MAKVLSERAPWYALQPTNAPAMARVLSERAPWYALSDAPSTFQNAIILFVSAFIISAVLLYHYCVAIRALRAMKSVLVGRPHPPLSRQESSDLEAAEQQAAATPEIDEMLRASPRTLYGVSVRRLAADMRKGEKPTRDIMQMLWQDHRYLERVVSADGVKHGKLAIISYRVIPAADGFTLDEAAFACAVEAARAHGVEYLWLDCWAYRKQPPWASYVHRDFLRTLATVMRTTDLVIWLPRSRAKGLGQYQYRVWCSFEAAMVQLRGLPVVMAGHGLSPMQLAVLAWGTWLVVPPWWLDDGSPCVRLGKYNFTFYCFVCAWLNYMLGVFSHQVYVGRPFANVIPGLAFGVAMAFAWAWLRTQRGAALMFARNGRRVLQVLALSGAPDATDPTPSQRGDGSMRADGLPPLTPTRALTQRRSWSVTARRPVLDVEELASTLPWLAAYDRRDIMTATAVLEHVQALTSSPTPRDGGEEANGRQRTPHSSGRASPRGAVALSIYYSALLRPAPGDAIKGRSVRVWLGAVGIKLLDEDSQRCSLLLDAPDDNDDASRDVADDHLAEAKSTYWLDSLAPMVLPTAVGGAGMAALNARQRKLSVATPRTRRSTFRPRSNTFGTAAVQLQLEADASSGGAEGAAAAQSSTQQQRSSSDESVRPSSAMPSVTPSIADEARVQRLTRTKAIMSGRSCLEHEGATTSSTSAMLESDLQVLSWQVLPGVRDFVQTPAGMYFAETRARNGQRLIHAERRVPHWNRGWAAATVAILLCMSAAYLFTAFTYPYQFGSKALTAADNAVFASMQLLGAVLFGVSRIGNDAYSLVASRELNLPLPFYPPARIEYALTFAMLGGYFLSMVARPGYLVKEWQCEWDARVCGAVTMLEGAGALVIGVIGVYEAVLAMAHSVAAAVRHRDARYALACTMRNLEAKFKVL